MRRVKAQRGGDQYILIDHRALDANKREINTTDVVTLGQIVLTAKGLERPQPPWGRRQLFRASVHV